MKAYLDSYIEGLLSNGNYTFTRNQLLEQFDTGEAAIRQCLQRLTRNKIVHQIRNGFYVIIPAEYRSAGILPPTMFIDALMHHLDRTYYVGLLSAAALHGAGHQQPQSFSVITTKPTIRPIKRAGLHIRFLVKSEMPQAGIEQKKTPTGFLNVSSPELTALDLMTYLKQSGGMASAAAVLEELAETLHPEKLSQAITESVPSTTLQRLGYIFDEIFGNHALADTLWAKLQHRSCFHVALAPGQEKQTGPISKKWKIHINMDLEDEL